MMILTAKFDKLLGIFYKALAHIMKVNQYFSVAAIDFDFRLVCLEAGIFPCLMGGFDDFSIVRVIR